MPISIGDKHTKEKNINGLLASILTLSLALSGCSWLDEDTEEKEEADIELVCDGYAYTDVIDSYNQDERLRLNQSGEELNFGVPPFKDKNTCTIPIEIDELGFTQSFHECVDPVIFGRHYHTFGFGYYLSQNPSQVGTINTDEDYNDYKKLFRGACGLSKFYMSINGSSERGYLLLHGTKARPPYYDYRADKNTERKEFGAAIFLRKNAINKGQELFTPTPVPYPEIHSKEFDIFELSTSSLAKLDADLDISSGTARITLINPYNTDKIEIKLNFNSDFEPESGSVELVVKDQVYNGVVLTPIEPRKLTNKSFEDIFRN